MIKWSEFLLPYEMAVEELKNKFKRIRDEYRKNNEHSPIEFVVGRVKQIPSIIEKARKLGITEENLDQ
ncbi:MAG: GTP pyrophosphokinase family protein, partial [Firmicutes bacterium]|nr:GTP pyrophosphokinase family protein [Bacillota bacterium]